MRTCYDVRSLIRKNLVLLNILLKEINYICKYEFIYITDGENGINLVKTKV